MAESMVGLKRSHRCTEVTSAQIGEKVTVMGWVQKSRNKGGIIFVDLRDLRRHDAVRRHQDRSVERLKFLLLTPPCIAVITLKIRIFLKCRIILRRKHL